jgi:hypothetical protein
VINFRIDLCAVCFVCEGWVLRGGYFEFGDDSWVRVEEGETINETIVAGFKSQFSSLGLLHTCSIKFYSLDIIPVKYEKFPTEKHANPLVSYYRDRIFMK